MSPTDNRTAKHEVLQNISQVEGSLQKVIDFHRDGRYGFISREWGFIAPGGLGGRLDGKFKPWEDKLAKVADFFWPVEAYEAMEKKPYGKPDPALKLPIEAEQLYGNIPLHLFLMEAPKEEVDLMDSDMEDYRDAAKIFLLLGTLSHLVGNSGPKNTELPSWIEDPLLLVAKRLKVEPTLTGHFLVQENWLWKSSLEPRQEERLSKAERHEVDRAIAKLLLEKCELNDRRYRFKIYHNCFVGSQAIDVLIEHGFAETREEACRVGRRVNKTFKLFSHVTNDHPLKDMHLFFRFRKRWQERSSSAVLEMPVADGLGEDIGGESQSEDEMDSSKISRLLRPKDIFKGSAKRSSSSSQDGAATNEHVPAGFVRVNSAESDSPSKMDQGNTPEQLGYERTDDEELVPDGEVLAAMAVMGGVTVKDRRYHFRTYKQCFVGSKLIDILVENQLAKTRQDALALALDINSRYGICEHVCGDHSLKDAYLFYRFTDLFRQFLASASSGETVSADGKFLQTSAVSTSVRGRTTSPDKTSVHFIDRKQSDGYPNSAGSGTDYDALLYGADEADEFRFESIDMLYPAFRNNHERVNQLIPTCMGYALRSLPFLIPEILSTMRDLLELELSGNMDGSIDENNETNRLCELLYQIAFNVSRCKEAFQLMSTDPRKRTFNSKHVSIRQTQPLSNGVLVRREKGGEPRPSKGTTGTQFPYFHLLDWLLGRHQFSENTDAGLVAKIAAVDDTYPWPQRDYIQALMKLSKNSTLRGFIEIIGCPRNVVMAYNHFVETYAGEGGLLQAHCRKLYSYIHNDVQSSTSGTNHISNGKESQAACPMSSAYNNHLFAKMMFSHMRKAADDRYRLRMPPLMTEVKKIVYSTSESGGFTTVALDLSDSGMLYEYGDIVKVLLPQPQKTKCAWLRSLSSSFPRYLRLKDMNDLFEDRGMGWTWRNLWEALGWGDFEKEGGEGVPLELIATYIEQGRILDDAGKPRWIYSPMAFVDDDPFAQPPTFTRERVGSLEPISPRIYSVSGVEPGRVFLMISKPQHGQHHGYNQMSDQTIERVHCSFSPATFFLVPAKGVNLVCVASGTGVSPFVGLVDAIGSRPGTYTIVHQCKSSDMFLSNSQNWLDFTTANPGAVVFGYISGDRSKRNCPMRYVIRNGAFEETSLLGRHSASAYYFECKMFLNRLKEVYHKDALNLAYCCGGVKSAIQPLKNVFASHQMRYEITCESYGVPATLGKESQACQIGGTVVNLDHVSPIHVGGDQILHQVQDIHTESHNSETPDLSEAFGQLHPHAYNLLRCLRAPEDADFDAFNAFLQRQAMTKSVMLNMATKYAQVALASPENSKVVRIASELQAKNIRQQIRHGDTVGALKSAEYLKALLEHVPAQDADAERWNSTLDEFNGSMSMNDSWC